MEKESVKKSSSKEVKVSTSKDSKPVASSSQSAPKDKAKGHSSKSLMVVALRNKFFFMLYRYASLVFITSILTFAMSIGFFVFFSRQPVPPQYIPINEDGTYIKLLPIADCNSKTEAEVKQFAMRAIKKLYKYDYINYAEQLQDAAAYFTGPAWNEYLESYQSAKTLFSVKENKWIVTVQPEGIPELIKNPYLDQNDGACIWELKAPITVSYIGSNAINSKGDLFLRITRVSVLKNQEGLSVKRSTFVPKT